MPETKIFPIRLGESLTERARAASQKKNISIAAFVKMVLSERLDELEMKEKQSPASGCHTRSEGYNDVDAHHAQIKGETCNDTYNSPT